MNEKGEVLEKDFICSLQRTNLLTYILVQPDRITRRSTLWRHTNNGWQILYHQGTIGLLHPAFESHEAERPNGCPWGRGIGEIPQINHDRAIIVRPTTFNIGIDASRIATRCEITSGIAIGNVGKCGGCAIEQGKNAPIASQSTRCLGHHTVESGGYEANIGGHPIAEQHMIGGGIASGEEIDRIFHFVTGFDIAAIDTTDQKGIGIKPLIGIDRFRSRVIEAVIVVRITRIIFVNCQVIAPSGTCATIDRRDALD
jgi:hypothetical protein